MDPKLLMKTGKQLCEIGTALLSMCEGMSNEKESEEGEVEGLLESEDESSEDESSEDEMPEMDESEEDPASDDEDRKKRVKLAKLKLSRSK